MENEKTVEKNVSSDEEEDNDGEEDEQEDEDGGNWITPENLYQVCKAMGGAMEDELDDIAVGCITTDFAIQVSKNTQTLFTTTVDHKNHHTVIVLYIRHYNTVLELCSILQQWTIKSYSTVY